MFWKLRILIFLKSNAHNWNTLFDKFPNNSRLYNSLKYLIRHGYIVENDDNSYSLSSYASVREYLCSYISGFIGFVGGSIAIIQFAYQAFLHFCGK